MGNRCGGVEGKGWREGDSESTILIGIYEYIFNIYLCISIYIYN